MKQLAKNSLRNHALAVLQVILIGTAGAQAEPLETLYVIGLPAVEMSESVPSETIVIPREKLAQFGSASLASVLEHIPSISINQNGGRGSFNGLFLRGADPNFTQVRIDGIAVNDATNTRGGAFDIGSINAQIIERIEIIADASSAVYGSQALAGIINIVTRSASLESAVEVDDHGGQVASVFVAGDSIAFSVVHERPGSALIGSQYQSDELGMKTNWQWADKHHLQIVGRHQTYDTQAYPDDAGGNLFSVNNALEKRDGKVVHLAAHYRYQSDVDQQLELNIGYFNQRENRLTPAIAPGLRDPFGIPAITSNTDYLRKTIEARYTKRVNGSVLWRSSVAWESELGQQTGQLDFAFFELPTNFDVERDTTSLSQSLELGWGDAFKFILSARLDDTESETVSSPRASASYRLHDPRHLLYSTLGQGFKQASIYALADPVIGNQSLLDETASSIQIGHRFQGKQWQINHSAYSYTYKNLIDFDAGPPPALVNRNQVKVRGLESSISYNNQASAWSFDLFQSYNSNKVLDNDTRLRQRPRYRAGLQIGYTLNDKLNFWAKSTHTSKRIDSSIPTASIELHSYSLTDLGLSWKLNSSWQLNTQWKNVFSESYSTSVGNQIKEDTLLVQLTFRGPKLF